MSGQKCVSTNVVLIQKDIFKEFESHIIQEMSKKKDISPLINDEYAKKVHEEINKAKKTGGKVLTGGDYKGGVISPTVISLPQDHELMSKELFAPVLRITQVENLKQAIDIINKNEFGLSSAIFTENPGEARTFFTEVETGLVYINSHTGGSEAHIPFGGLKSSGNGFRLGNPKYAIEAFSEVKTVKWNM
jgi:aldehyde dehydrogenase (NAD+)